MVIIVKRLIPVYQPADNVPKKYLNLRKLTHVTSFKHLYPTIPKILNQEYNIAWDEKLVIYFMKEVRLPHFTRYRTKFRKVYAGLLKDLGQHLSTIRNRNR